MAHTEQYFPVLLRSAVLEQLSRGMASAPEIYHDLEKRTGISVSSTSVYNQLRGLLSEGSVREVVNPDAENLRKSWFELTPAGIRAADTSRKLIAAIYRTHAAPVLAFPTHKAIEHGPSRLEQAGGHFRQQALRQKRRTATA